MDCFGRDCLNIGVDALSHFGIGEGLASILTALLLAGLAFMVFKMVLNAFRAKPQPAGTDNGYSRDDRSDVGQTNSPSPFTVASTTDTETPKVAATSIQTNFYVAPKAFSSDCKRE